MCYLFGNYLKKNLHNGSIFPVKNVLNNYKIGVKVNNKVRAHDN